MATGTRSGNRTIAVYADWDGLTAPLRLGGLRARRGAGREVFEFKFDKLTLDDRACANLRLDPRLGLYDLSSRTICSVCMTRSASARCGFGPMMPVIFWTTSTTLPRRHLFNCANSRPRQPGAGTRRGQHGSPTHTTLFS